MDRRRCRRRAGPRPTFPQRLFRQLNADGLETLSPADWRVLSKAHPVRVHSLKIDSTLLGVMRVESERRPAGVEHGEEGDTVHFRERDRGDHV